MALLVASDVVMGSHRLAYVTLLLATASLGIGFGFTVPSLNTFAAAFNPVKADGSVLVLNALLGLGTALAPVFVAIFVGLGFWWGLPLTAAAALTVLLLVSTRLPFATPRGDSPSDAGAARTPIPARFYLYAAFALGYGICETMNGNWASLDMTKLGATTTQASIALTTFWASVTLGRVVFAVIRQHVPTWRTYRVLPLVLAIAFVIIWQLPKNQPAFGIVAFGVAGIGCSALLPLTISFGQEEFVALSAAVAGYTVACYQLGYGIAAFGAGPIQDAGVKLSTLYAITALFACALAVLAVLMTRHGLATASLHPRPHPHQMRPSSAAPGAAA
jgi:hypothetical protein